MRWRVDCPGQICGGFKVKEERKPFNGQCSKCNHVWTIAYTPMDLTVFCKVCKKACCPMCGADSKNIITPPNKKE